MSKNIVLIGMMGAGKTTISKLLSEKLDDMNLVDIDSVIVKLENRSINEIFKDSGEEYFRNIESGIIESYSIMSDFIISTGGGVCEEPANIENLKQNGVLFYLYTSADDIYARVANDDARPLLKSSNVKLTIEKLLEKRDPLYRLSNYIIDTTDRTPEKITEEILEKYYGIIG